ncbi:PREDICTED: COX assembly mitochondrial protein homolog [Ceratosolen solmsi marchali]|uniref:COX assembly mitochondrial protein n=1 Tax=Ceratosolen solmsi marchali TaxID=326594 RepID=A0AAJ7E1V7_9HYME|nr:PREDICTED: COX assembly mitochondrial protein homolog [Ceratosolen solmsi marchali]
MAIRKITLYGDPDDRFLRKVEKDVLVAQIVRNKAREEKCVPEVAAFEKCCIEYKYAMVFKCQNVNTILKDCLIKWYNDKEFWNECTEYYIKERSEYRRTGEPKKIRHLKTRVANYV